MISKFILTLVLFIHVCLIYGQDGIKSSLTFVIDDSGSMGYEINEVREKIDTIYDSAMRANNSLIENFILVTFNDPDVQVRTRTKDRDELKTALAEIDVHGGGDCPEYSLTGIKLALEVSLPYSYVFVFTDASAKDYNNMMFQEIKNLAEAKRIRIFFILTGICRSVYEVSYQVYHQLAKATDGQVFDVLKNNVKDIIPIVIQNIRSRRHVLIPAEPSKVYTKKFSFTVYSETDEVFIYVKGQTPKIQIFNAEGRHVDFEQNRRTNGILIVKVQRTKPGLYAAKVVSTSEISVQVLGSTTVNFMNE